MSKHSSNKHTQTPETRENDIVNFNQPGASTILFAYINCAAARDIII